MRGRTPGVLAAAGISLWAGAGAAMACSPVLFTPSDVPQRGERCGIVTHLEEIRAVGLSPATDLGQGLVVQDIFDGNACYWEANFLIHDCAAGVALVIGPDYRALMEEPRETGIDRIDAALRAELAAGARPDTEALSARAEAEGYGAALRVGPGQRIRVNGHPVATDCACATFYPGGARSN